MFYLLADAECRNTSKYSIYAGFRDVVRFWRLAGNSNLRRTRRPPVMRHGSAPGILWTVVTILRSGETQTRRLHPAQVKRTENQRTSPDDLNRQLWPSRPIAVPGLPNAASKVDIAPASRS